MEDYPAARWAFYKALDMEPRNKECITNIEKVESLRKIPPKAVSASLFRVSDNYLEVFTGKWNKLFIKGINLGPGVPGYFPGEYAVKKTTYLQWFKQIADLGINAVRIYALHPPSFYETLHEFNQKSGRLYLLQGIWTELPEDGNFDDKKYMHYVAGNIKDAVDAVYGKTVLPEKPGYPSGRYDYDVSGYTAAFVFGREREACAVKNFNNMRGNGKADYVGSFLKISAGDPFEIWITKACDHIQDYEYKLARLTHPVTVNNWPTLDPLTHPSKSDKIEEMRALGIPAGQDRCDSGGYLSLQEDMETLDVTKITAHGGPVFLPHITHIPIIPIL